MGLNLMRISVFLILFTLLLGVTLWVTLSGALLAVASLFLLLFIVITVGYTDTAILFILGAREVKGADEEEFHAAAAQEAYKLAVTQPRLYFYNGALERSFVLQNRKNISLVLSRELLSLCTRDELAAISFELLLQVKKGLAPKRTKVMFMIAFFSWFGHSSLALLMRLIPVKSFRHSLNWFMHYLLQPWIELFFKFTLGEKYFRRLQLLLVDYPKEKNLLLRVGSKLRRQTEIYSLSSRKFIELGAINKSRHFQDILVLEFLPHEWDLLFSPEWESRA
jgi:hypothetical protein